MDRPQIEDSDSDSDRVDLLIKISWTKKKLSAEALFCQKDFEKAMEGYEAAAEAANDQRAGRF
jgi:hypothetical protein